MKLTYWVQRGRSRPNCCRIASRSAALAPGSARSTAGSPVTRIERKIVSDRRKSVTSANPSRLTMNFFIASCSSRPDLQWVVSSPSAADPTASGRGTSAEKRRDYARFYCSVNVLARQRLGASTRLDPGAHLREYPVGWRLVRTRSEERRVGKECRSRWWPYH